MNPPGFSGSPFPPSSHHQLHESTAQDPNLHHLGIPDQLPQPIPEYSNLEEDKAEIESIPSQEQRARYNVKVALICDFFNHFHGNKSISPDGRPVESEIDNLNNLFLSHIQTLCPLDLEYALLNPEADILVGELLRKLLAKKEKVKLDPHSVSFYTDWNEMLMQKVAKMYKSFLRIKDKLFKEFGLSMIKLDSNGEVIEDKEAFRMYPQAKSKLGLTWQQIKRDYILPKTSLNLKPLNQTATRVMASLSLEHLSLLQFFENSFKGGNPFIDESRAENGEPTIIKVQGNKPGVWIMRENYKKFHELSIDERIEILHYFCMHKLETPEQLNFLNCSDSDKIFEELVCVVNGVEYFRFINHNDSRIYKRDTDGTLSLMFGSFEEVERYICTDGKGKNKIPKLRHKLTELYQTLRQASDEGQAQFEARQKKLQQQFRTGKTKTYSKFYNILPVKESPDVRGEEANATERMKRAITQVNKEQASNVYGSLAQKKRNKKAIDRGERLKQRKERAELERQESENQVFRGIGRPRKMLGPRSYHQRSGSYQGSDDVDSNDINLEGKFEARNERNACIKGEWYQTNNRTNKQEFEYVYIPSGERQESDDFRIESADIPGLFSGAYQGFIMLNEEKVLDKLELEFEVIQEEGEEQNNRYKVEGKGVNKIGSFEIRGEMLYLGEDLEFDCKKYYNTQEENRARQKRTNELMARARARAANQFPRIEGNFLNQQQIESLPIKDIGQVHKNIRGPPAGLGGGNMMGDFERMVNQSAPSVHQFLNDAGIGPISLNNSILNSVSGLGLQNEEMLSAIINNTSLDPLINQTRQGQLPTDPNSSLRQNSIYRQRQEAKQNLNSFSQNLTALSNPHLLQNLLMNQIPTHNTNPANLNEMCNLLLNDNLFSSLLSSGLPNQPQPQQPNLAALSSLGPNYGQLYGLLDQQQSAMNPLQSNLGLQMLQQQTQQLNHLNSNNLLDIVRGGNSQQDLLGLQNLLNLAQQGQQQPMMNQPAGFNMLHQQLQQLQQPQQTSLHALAGVGGGGAGASAQDHSSILQSLMKEMQEKQNLEHDTFLQGLLNQAAQPQFPSQMQAQQQPPQQQASYSGLSNLLQQAQQPGGMRSSGSDILSLGQHWGLNPQHDQSNDPHDNGANQ